MFAACERAHPYEACGLIGGLASVSEFAWIRHCKNDLARLAAENPGDWPAHVNEPGQLGTSCDPRTGFRMRFADLVFLAQQCEKEGFSCVVYHSHPDGGSGLSGLDRRFGPLWAPQMTQLGQLVVSLRNRRVCRAQRYVYAGTDFRLFCDYDPESLQSCATPC